ncbi:MAG: hypothetical protein Q7Q71_15120 [Verrucomicrobiota bacterium JB023]|nr:hypothetical protein [Verrucomicrobiota bacterium JB023]
MSEMDKGDQPLDQLMEKWGLANNELVEASTEQLTHKQVQKARKGRRLTLKMMMKVTRAFNVAIWYRLSKEEKEAYFEYGWKHLFNYAKGFEAGWQDPNDELIAARSDGD